MTFKNLCDYHHLMWTRCQATHFIFLYDNTLEPVFVLWSIAVSRWRIVKTNVLFPPSSLRNIWRLKATTLNLSQYEANVLYVALMFMKSSDIYLSSNIFRTDFQKEIRRKIWNSGNNQQSTVVVKVANYIRRMATLFKDKWSESFNTVLANYIIAGSFNVRLFIEWVVQKIAETFFTCQHNKLIWRHSQFDVSCNDSKQNFFFFCPLVSTNHYLSNFLEFQRETTVFPIAIATACISVNTS